MVPENIHTLPTEGIGISRGVGGGSKAQENPEGGGRLYQFILLFPDRFHYSYMLNFLCLHFVYCSADTNIDLVNCTKLIIFKVVRLDFWCCESPVILPNSG